MVGTISRVGFGGMVLLGVSATAGRAQGLFPTAIGVEFDARSGLVAKPNSGMSSVLASPSPGSFLNMMQGGVLARWQRGAIEGTVAMSLADASAEGTHETYPLGALHFGVHRGAFTFLLGVEQNVGVASRLRTIPRRDSVQGPDTGGAASANYDNGSGGTIPTVLLTSLGSMPGALVRTTDAIGGVAWDRGRAHLSVETGLQTVNLAAGSVWVGAMANLELLDGVALTVNTRQESRSSAIQMPSVSVGLRMLRWPFAQASHPVTSAHGKKGEAMRAARVEVGDSVIRLYVLLPTAQRVTVAGDLTNWAPRGMTREEGGWWCASFHQGEGISRIHLRSDAGDWGPVPGLPTTVDEYGGTMSLLVVKAPSR